MKRLFALLIAAMLAGAPPFLAAEDERDTARNGGAPQEQESPQEQKPPKKTDPLIEAAKAAKSQRKKTSTKVITNADVKRSKGKLIVIDSKAPAEKKAPVATESSLQKQDERYKARLAAQEGLVEAEKDVAERQKELELIEQRYYQENDPNYRDTVLQERFAQVKRQLEDARAAAADARDALQKIEAPQP
ncbi:MAG TPA: hypothetical protein VMS98_17350 [Thermoanaerobaculia bacterium]|nr:hypothetical protein [Thermoanaerobaculia bacterium]